MRRDLYADTPTPRYADTSPYCGCGYAALRSLRPPVSRKEGETLRTVENASRRRDSGVQILPQKKAMPVPRIMIEVSENLIPAFLVEI
jgi:hypothetical protein